MSLEKIEQRIHKIKQALLSVGEMRPGSVSKQYSVCASKGCKCKDPEKPKKHGPYAQLSYVHAGKHTTRFIRPHQVKTVKSQLAQYKRFKKLMDQWLALAIDHAEIKLQMTKEIEASADAASTTK